MIDSLPHEGELLVHRMYVRGVKAGTTAGSDGLFIRQHGNLRRNRQRPVQRTGLSLQHHMCRPGESIGHEPGTKRDDRPALPTAGIEHPVLPAAIPRGSAHCTTGTDRRQ